MGDRWKDGEGRQTERRKWKKTERRRSETDGKTEKGDRRKDGEGRQTERRRRETDGKTYIQLLTRPTQNISSALVLRRFPLDEN